MRPVEAQNGVCVCVCVVYKEALVSNFPLSACSSSRFMHPFITDADNGPSGFIIILTLVWTCRKMKGEKNEVGSQGATSLHFIWFTDSNTHLA